MIFAWIGIIFRLLLKLIIPPPKPPDDPQIDPNEKCPACGHRDGSIEAVQDAKGKYVKHTCRVCRAWWLVKPVLETRSNLFAAKPE